MRMISVKGSQRVLQLLSLGFMILFLGGCLSTAMVRPVPAPWNPATDVVEQAPPIGEVAPVFWLADSAPVIDGDFSEWDGLVSADPYVSVYGGGHQPDDVSGRFVIASDGPNLYLFAEITDDQANENPLTPSMAWRNDSVEFFFGTDTRMRSSYVDGDSQIRVVPVSREEDGLYSLAINDVDMTGQTQAWAEFTDTGYIIEAALDLALLRLDPLSPGQQVRVEFQINDGDSTERDRLVHWMSEKDDPWYNPGGWGDGVVVTPEEAGNDG